MKKYLVAVILCLFAIQLFSIDSIAEVLKVKGEVVLSRNNNNYDVVQGDDFFNGDQVETKFDAFAAIQFVDESSIVKLFPNTILNINTKKKDNSVIKINILEVGKIWAKVKKGSGTFKIETPTSIASVKGTNFLISRTEEGITQLFTFGGSVQLTNKSDGLSTFVDAGMMCETTGSGDLAISKIDYDMIDKSVSDFIEEEVIPKKTKIKEEPKKSQKTKKQEDDSSSSSSVTPITPEAQESETELEFGQESSTDDGPINIGAGLGSVSINGELYTQIRLMPELTIGKFGAGLDIELLVDNDGSVREEDWDEWQDYMNKIYYLRYGQRSDKIYGRFGGFPSYTLGHGLIMNDYSNMLKYPEIRQLGLQIGGKIPFYEMEAELFSSDITENDILAGQLSFRPLQKTDIPFLKNIKIGAVGAIDMNQNNGLLDSDCDGYYDYFDDYPLDANQYSEALEWYKIFNGDSLDFASWADSSDYELPLPKSSYPENDIGAWGLNYELPLLSTKILSLAHYGELAEIRKNPNTKFFENSGFIFPGFYAEFSIFRANLEFRQFGEGFAPAYFNQLYDHQRATVDTANIVLKEDTLTPENYPASSGWMGSVTSNILNIAELSIIYQDMYADSINNKAISGTLLLKKSLIPKLNSAEITYSQNQFEWDNFAFKAPSAFIEGKVSYNLSANSVLIAAYQQRYLDLNGDGKISGDGEIISTTNIGVEFKF